MKSIDVAGHPRGWWKAGNNFRSDSATEPALSLPKLRLLATVARPQTFTCVPPGSGYRMGIDRDEDGRYDYDEILHGTDPASPDGVQPMPATKLMIKNRIPDDEVKNSANVKVQSATMPIPPVGSERPRCGSDPSGTVKATLTLSSTASGESTTSPLPCQNWSLIGADENPLGYKYADKGLFTGTVSKLSWKRGKDLKATLTGKGPSVLDYDLQTGVAQNPVYGQLVSGQTGICFECASGTRDGSDGKLFSAKGADCPAPASCP